METSWTRAFSHDAYLFVPPQNGSTGPGPYLNFSCNAGNSSCATAYPYACINEKDTAPGDGVTLVSKLLGGTYQYWVQVHDNTAAGELTIVLRDKSGRVVRDWQNPANQTNDQKAWHVFDVDGMRGSVASVDQIMAGNLPMVAANPFTFVCTF